jgi:hypothetical protein
MFAWRNARLLDEKNGWGPENNREKLQRLDTPQNATGPIAGPGYRHFIGTHDVSDWAVLAHCESGKFQNFGLLSPGEQINASLLKLSRSMEGHLQKVEKDGPVNWAQASANTALFLVDSPHYNPYVRSILDNYSAYLAGGAVRFVDDRSQAPLLQRIDVPTKQLRSTKKENMRLFDRFEDYLLVMRLPGFIPRTTTTTVEVSDVDTHKVIWE